MPSSLKAVALIIMGLFLYSRFLNGSLLFYINERFVWLTFLASVGFILVGVSYRYAGGYGAKADHRHGNISWGGLFLVMLPVLLGLLVPPRPLGAAAMSNRTAGVQLLTPAVVLKNSDVLSKPATEKNILDWLIEFRTGTDQFALAGQKAKLVGFVYRDEHFGAEEFMISRFVISCCAADAAPIGLLVRAKNSSRYSDDDWVEVSGHFDITQLAGESMPVLITDKIVATNVPDQPYLYPY